MWRFQNSLPRTVLPGYVCTRPTCISARDDLTRHMQPFCCHICDVNLRLGVKFSVIHTNVLAEVFEVTPVDGTAGFGAINSFDIRRERASYEIDVSAIMRVQTAPTSRKYYGNHVFQPWPTMTYWISRTCPCIIYTAKKLLSGQSWRHMGEIVYYILYLESFPAA